jgi:cardiolipin synthase
MLIYSVLKILYPLTFLLIPVVITRKKRPTSALGWIMAIIFLPFMGAFLYLLFGTDRIKNKGKQKFISNVGLREKHHDIEPDWFWPNLREVKYDLPFEAADILRVSSKLSPFGAVEGNALEILVDGEETYQKMEEAILGAQHHVNLDYYIFDPDKVGARFRDLLVKKAGQGVKINFLYDAIGSLRLGWAWRFLDGFRVAGIEPREFLPLRTFFKPWNINLRNHRKLLIVDNKIGFTGGINIGEDFLNGKGNRWRDTHMRLEGPAVAQLQWVFCEDWYFATGEDLFNPDYFPPVETSGDYIAQVVPGGPDQTQEVIPRLFFTAISEAKKSVYITTPYFIPDLPVFTALQAAALRGVDVRLLLPFKSDHPFVLLAARSYYEDLLKSGARIFEYMPGILHAKMLVVDDHFVVLGSANLDIRSFSYSFELNVQVYSEIFTEIAVKVFLKDLENARELTADEFLRRPSHVEFAENVCRLFSPLL